MLSNFAYQGSDSPTSLTALAAQSVGSNTGSYSQSQGSYFVTNDSGSSFPGCFHPSNRASSSNSVISSPVNTEVWVSDPGATHHMTSDLRNLTIAQPYNDDTKITIRNGTGLIIAHTSSGYIKHVAHVLKLNTVLHVPNLAMNLLSFTKLCRDNHCFITLDEHTIAVQDKVSKVILYQGKSSEEGLFLFKSPLVLSFSPFSHSAFVGAATSYPVWHQRLGHPSHAILSKMLSESKIKLPREDSHSVCTYFLDGKMHRLPFNASVSQASEPFSKVHSNV